MRDLPARSLVRSSVEWRAQTQNIFQEVLFDHEKLKLLTIGSILKKAAKMKLKTANPKIKIRRI